MKTKQTWCKKCERCDHGGCTILIDTVIKTEHPCGKITYHYPLKREIESLGGKTFTNRIYRNSGVGCEFSWIDDIPNYIDKCSLNKGNCKYYIKSPWWKFL